MRVPGDGGEPQLLFNVTDGMPWDVQQMPDGDTIVFGLVKDFLASARGQNGAVEEAQVVAQSLRTGQRKVLIARGSAPRYASTGHLLYARAGILFGRRFDLGHAEMVGEEVPVVEGVRRSEFLGAGTTTAYYDVSTSGSLAYVPGPISRVVQQSLAVLDPQKGVELLKLQPSVYQSPRVSPDGKLIAVAVLDGRSQNIWIYDRSTGNMRQLTSTGRNQYPVWSSDSLSVTFQSDREGDFGLFTQRADGSRTAERLTKADEGTAHVPDDWSPDGRTLLFEMIDDRKSDRTLWALSSGRKRQIEGPDFHGGAAAFIQATFSPNGRWFAYRSLVKDGAGVAVQPFPPTGPVFPISDPMLFPVWARDGRTLFFNRMASGEFYAVPVTTEATFTFGTPRRLPFPSPIENRTRIRVTTISLPMGHSSASLHRARQTPGRKSTWFSTGVRI